MDPNSWFYTLSAIPQTLAAVVALAATFVVFKLNFIQEKIRDIRVDLRRFILLLTSYEHKEIHDIEPLSDEKFFELYEKSLKNIDVKKENFGLEKGIYEKLRSEMSRIIKDDWKSFYPPREQRISGYLNTKKIIFKDFLSKKKNSMMLLGWSLLTSVFAIIMSLVALPNYYKVVCPELIVGVILTGAVVSMFLTAASVWIIARK